MSILKDSQKAARNRWDSANMKVISCKVTNELAEKFKALTSANGTTPNEVFRNCIMDYISEHDV